MALEKAIEAIWKQESRANNQSDSQEVGTVGLSTQASESMEQGMVKDSGSGVLWEN